MRYNEEQQKEIETIKERNITLKLSDADCERIAEMAGKHGITVGELLENFIGDLVIGTYTNGSDERYMARQWFDRCWFGSFPEKTLLKHLLEWDYDVEELIEAYDEKVYAITNPEEFGEYEEGAEWFDDVIADCTEEFFERNKDLDIQKEIENCRKWLVDLKNIKGDIH